MGIDNRVLRLIGLSDVLRCSQPGCGKRATHFIDHPRHTFTNRYRCTRHARQIAKRLGIEIENARVLERS